jgi:hypothetical protein
MGETSGVEQAPPTINGKTPRNYEAWQKIFARNQGLPDVNTASNTPDGPFGVIESNAQTQAQNDAERRRKKTPGEILNYFGGTSGGRSTVLGG